MTAPKGEGIQPNPFDLSIEERTAPGNPKLRRDWLNKVIARQTEGISHGIRPQNIYGISYTMLKTWHKEVWEPFVQTLDQGEQDVINGGYFTKGRKKHRKTGGGSSLKSRGIEMPSYESQRSRTNDTQSTSN